MAFPVQSFTPSNAASPNAKPPKNPARPAPIPVIPIATLRPPEIPFFKPIMAPAARISPNAVIPSTPTPLNELKKLCINLAIFSPGFIAITSPITNSAPFSAIISPPKNPTRPAPIAVIPATILSGLTLPIPAAAPAMRIANNAPTDSTVLKAPRKLPIKVPSAVPSTSNASFIFPINLSLRRIPTKNPPSPAPIAVIPAINLRGSFALLPNFIIAAAIPTSPTTIAPLTAVKEPKKLFINEARPVPSTSNASDICLVTKSPRRIPVKNPPRPAAMAVIPAIN